MISVKLIVVLSIIIALVVLLFLIYRRNKYYKRLLQNMSVYAVTQRMFELMASTIPATNKIEELNNIMLEVFNSKSSTISIFDGTEYEIKATNIEPIYSESVKELAKEKYFSTNAEQNVSKYAVATGGRVLGYKSAAERKIRSAMFSPIYYNGIYLGFWLLEDDAENAFDSISKEELSKLKDHIGVFVENVLNQASIEGAYNTDKQTGFYNKLYLYSTVKKKTSVEESSVLTLLQLSNLPDINNTYGREVGNRLLEKAVRLVHETFSKDNILIRYSGSKFCIVTLGSTAEEMHGTIERYISNVNMEEFVVRGEKISLKVNAVMRNIRKQSNLDKELNKMSNYIEKMTDTNAINIL